MLFDQHISTHHSTQHSSTQLWSHSSQTTHRFSPWNILTVAEIRNWTSPTPYVRSEPGANSGVCWEAQWWSISRNHTAVLTSKTTTTSRWYTPDESCKIQPAAAQFCNHIIILCLTHQSSQSKLKLGFFKSLDIYYLNKDNSCRWYFPWVYPYLSAEQRFTRPYVLCDNLTYDM